MSTDLVASWHFPASWPATAVGRYDWKKKKAQGKRRGVFFSSSWLLLVQFLVYRRILGSTQLPSIPCICRPCFIFLFSPPIRFISNSKSRLPLGQSHDPNHFAYTRASSQVNQISTFLLLHYTIIIIYIYLFRSGIYFACVYINNNKIIQEIRKTSKEE